MSDDNDPKAEPTEAAPPSRPVVSGKSSPPRPAGLRVGSSRARAPRASTLLEPERGKELDTGGRSGLLGNLPTRAPDGGTPAPRGKLASVEEISASLLLPYDGDGSAQAADDVEELSGSVLLDDPSAARAGDRSTLPSAVLNTQDPERKRPQSVKPPLPRSVKPPPPRAAGAPLARSVPPSPARSVKPPPPRSIKPPPPSSASSLLPRRTEAGPATLAAASPPPPVIAPPPGVAPAPEALAATPAPMAEARAASNGALEPSLHSDDSDRLHELETLPIGSMRAPLGLVRPTAQQALAEQEEPPPPAAAATDPDDDDLATLPRDRMGGAIDALRGAMQRLMVVMQTKSRRPLGDELPPRFLWITTATGMAGGIGAALLVAGMLRPPATVAVVARPVASSPPARATASAVIPAVAPALAPVPKTPAAAPAPPKACTLAGTPHVLAPAAGLAAGIEARALGDDDVALGFASADHEATTLRLSPSSPTTATTTTVKWRTSIRRVTPFVSPKGDIQVAVDVDGKNDPILGRRTLTVDPPIQVGAAADGLVWAHRGGPPAGKLWSLDGEGDVQALRGATETTPDGTTVALAFRRGNAIQIGLATGRETLAPAGDLVRVEGLGAGVGSPAVALGDGFVVVVWADRASANDPWGLRWLHFKAGQTPGAPAAWSPPPGGKGEQAMSPAVAAIAGKRFLLVWAEGPTSGHQVRGVTISEAGEIIGAPLDISGAGSNAGQGQPVVTPAGRGLVAFLESGDSGFHVAATPIACDP